jgi:hypothetical protein
MIPKEKAKELFNKFAFEKTPEGYKMFQTSNESKRCSLIAVNEIIQAIEDIFETLDEREYWQSVKQEIEKF